MPPYTRTGLVIFFSNKNLVQKNLVRKLNFTIFLIKDKSTPRAINLLFYRQFQSSSKKMEMIFFHFTNLFVELGGGVDDVLV